MKKQIKTLVGIIIIATTFFMACDKEEKNNYNEDIKGVWITFSKDNIEMETNNKFLMDIDQYQDYAIGIYNPEGDDKWIVNRDYEYYFDDNKLYMNGTSHDGLLYELIFNIIRLDNSEFEYSVDLLSIAGIVIDEPFTYISKKSVNNFEDEIIGLWEEISKDGVDQTTARWEYNNDNTFIYSYKENDVWIEKVDNDGEYYVYGDFMASIFTNNILTAEEKRQCECWEIVSISDNIMEWTALREDGVVATYRMRRVE
ncbi:hypothetical protein ACFLTI_08780 [Bacteroidota bacterium]